MLNFLADSALCIAISTSCSAVGSWLTAQSANTITSSDIHIKNTDDTSEALGLVFTSCKAGRNTSAVVCSAPETSPSTSPSCSISVASIIGFLRASLASDSDNPLCFLSSISLSTYLSKAFSSKFIISISSGSVKPFSSATLLIFSLSPNNTH